MRLPIGRVILATAMLAAGCVRATTGPSIDDTRAELLGYVEDITAADGYRYDAVDDRGHGLGASKIIPLEAQGLYAIVYFWWDETYDGWTVSLATSTDLLNWSWRVDLGEYASQPYIAPASDGGYVVAWEQEPPTQDQSHVRLLYYSSWNDLLAAAPSKMFDAERQLSPCAEGTPNIYAASSARVDFGFHYYADCETDREARGTSDWVSWEATTEVLLDRGVLFQGYRGSIGDRDTIVFRGYPFTFLEAQFVQNDWRTFRVLLYDEGIGASDPLSRRYPDVPLGGPYPEMAPTPPSTHVFLHTHRGSFAFTNFSVTEVTYQGRPTIVVTVFIPQEGAAPGEVGGLIYYRFYDEASQD